MGAGVAINGTMAAAARRAVAAAVVVGCCGAAVARADTAWPAVSPEWLARGTAGGIAILPLVCWWIWVALWARTSDWICRDSTLLKLRPDWWTAWAVFPFAVLALAAWWIPWAAAGQLLMAVAWILPLFLYSRVRNPKLPEGMRVFTVGHARRSIAALLSSFGVKMKEPEKADDGLPHIALLATGAASPEENLAVQERAGKLPGFPALLTIMQEALASRASKVFLDIFPDGVRVRNEVDGLVGAARAVKPAPKSLGGKSKQPDTWEDATPFDAAAAKALVGAVEELATVPAAEAAEKQPGFDIEVAGKKRPCKLTIRTLKTSRQMVLALDEPPLAPKKLEDLGMSADMANQVRGLLTLEKGLFIVSSPPLTGCTTTFDTVLASTDRLIRDFVSVESGDDPPKEIQNIKQVRYSPKAGETAVAALAKAMLEYPRGVVARDVADAELAAKLVDLADDQTIVIMSIRAGDAIDAVQRLLALKVAREKLARSLIGSLAQRLVRKLCPQCGEGVPPTPDFLQRAGLTAEELPEIKKPSTFGGCRACYGRQFSGRTAIYELASGPTLRQQLATESEPKVLRQAAVKDGMRALLSEGLAAVAAGTTALEELQRVFAVKKEAGSPGAKK